VVVDSAIVIGYGVIVAPFRINIMAISVGSVTANKSRAALINSLQRRRLKIINWIRESANGESSSAGKRRQWSRVRAPTRVARRGAGRRFGDAVRRRGQCTSVSNAESLAYFHSRLSSLPSDSLPYRATSRARCRHDVRDEGRSEAEDRVAITMRTVEAKVSADRSNGPFAPRFRSAIIFILFPFP